MGKVEKLYLRNKEEEKRKKRKKDGRIWEEKIPEIV